MKELKQEAEKQEEMEDKIEDISENIITYYNEADTCAKQLTAAIDAGNSSMQDIAQSMENTADELQEQSQMCAAIQDNAREAKVQADIMDKVNEALTNIYGLAKELD